MLTITPTAADILTKARTQKGAPDAYGVRFYATEEDGSGRARLAFAFVGSPEDEDTVIDGAAIDAYVAPDVDRLVGDVTVDVKQEAGETRLVVRRSTQP